MIIEQTIRSIRFNNYIYTKPNPTRTFFLTKHKNQIQIKSIPAILFIINTCTTHALNNVVIQGDFTHNFLRDNATIIL